MGLGCEIDQICRRAANALRQRRALDEKARQCLDKSGPSTVLFIRNICSDLRRIILIITILAVRLQRMKGKKGGNLAAGLRSLKSDRRGNRVGASGRKLRESALKYLESLNRVNLCAGVQRPEQGRGRTRKSRQKPLKSLKTDSEMSTGGSWMSRGRIDHAHATTGRVRRPEQRHNADAARTCEASTSAAVARLARLGTLRPRPFRSTGSSRRVSGRVAGRKRLLQLLVELLFRH
jgi:hypothetical protein